MAAQVSAYMLPFSPTSSLKGIINWMLLARWRTYRFVSYSGLSVKARDGLRENTEAQKDTEKKERDAKESRKPGKEKVRRMENRKEKVHMKTNAGNPFLKAIFFSSKPLFTFHSWIPGFLIYPPPFFLHFLCDFPE